MTRIILLERLRAFTEEVTADLITGQELKCRFNRFRPGHCLRQQGFLNSGGGLQFIGHCLLAGFQLIVQHFQLFFGFGVAQYQIFQ